jgi:hypothetical protein
MMASRKINAILLYLKSRVAEMKRMADVNNMKLGKLSLLEHNHRRENLVSYIILTFHYLYDRHFPRLLHSIAYK